MDSCLDNLNSTEVLNIFKRCFYTYWRQKSFQTHLSNEQGSELSFLFKLKYCFLNRCFALRENRNWAASDALLLKKNWIFSSQFVFSGTISHIISLTTFHLLKNISKFHLHEFQCEIFGSWLLLLPMFSFFSRFLPSLESHSHTYFLKATYHYIKKQTLKVACRFLFVMWYHSCRWEIQSLKR